MITVVVLLGARFDHCAGHPAVGQALPINGGEIGYRGGLSGAVRPEEHLPQNIILTKLFYLDPDAIFERVAKLF